ncbi:hypothetical protein BKA62DRAFT_834516 [Auriculariales sp. MPI-PUGE-AT-0066]|nr:hypothetical protein BKA62DRAFT_834516 [Auriculariales sp. MPI-PUGE-AT-0066]
MEHLMWLDDREGSNVLQGASVPSDWSLGPRTATGDIDYAAMGLPTPAPDDELSLDTLAPANLVSAGTGLGPHQPLNSPVPLYPFQGQSNSLPAISGPSIAYNAPPQNPNYLPDPWFMQGLGASSSNAYGTPAPRQFPQYYPQPAPFPQWVPSPSGLPYHRYDSSSLSWNGQYHPSAMAAAPPLSMGNIQGPGPMTAPSSSMAPRTGTKRWMSAEVAENGGPDLTTSKYARLAGQPSRINEGRMKRSPLGEITGDAQNTMARQDLVATPRGAGSEYVRPIAGKKRGRTAKQSAAAPSPADNSIRDIGGASSKHIPTIPSKEQNVVLPDPKPPTPTSISSLSPELVVPTAPGPANIPAPSTAGGPVGLVEETAAVSTQSSSPKPYETMTTVAKSAQDPADGCSSGTTTSIEPIDDASGAPNGRDVSSSLESGIGQAVTPADGDALPVVSDEDAYLFRELLPDATVVVAESTNTAGPTAGSSNSLPSAPPSVPFEQPDTDAARNPMVIPAVNTRKPLVTAEANAILQKVFDKRCDPKDQELSRLVAELKLSLRKVKDWFRSARRALTPTELRERRAAQRLEASLAADQQVEVDLAADQRVQNPRPKGFIAMNPDDEACKSRRVSQRMSEGARNEWCT